MAHFKSIESSDSKAIEIIYGDCTVESMAQVVEDSFNRDGYMIKTGELGNRTYSKGNRIVRLLLGAFYKYFEFHVGVHPAGENTVKVSLTKTSSGMSGGVIGVNQVKKELARLQMVLQGL